jgi:hypothetical protein
MKFVSPVAIIGSRASSARGLPSGDRHLRPCGTASRHDGGDVSSISVVSVSGSAGALSGSAIRQTPWCWQSLTIVACLGNGPKVLIDATSVARRRMWS